jgi:allantoin racemase
VDYPPGVAPMPVRIIREIEAESLLKGIKWDFDLGMPGPIVENREELAQIVPGVLKLVREACESGKYNAIILTLDCMAINIRQNIMSYGMNEKCASVRSIEWPVRNKLNLDPAEAVEDFVKECIEAIEKDGADVVVVGCAALIYMQQSVHKRLKELGYDVPVSHPVRCANEMAKALVNMKVSQSKYAYPSTTPKKKSTPR